METHCHESCMDWCGHASKNYTSRDPFAIASYSEKRNYKSDAALEREISALGIGCTRRMTSKQEIPEEASAQFRQKGKKIYCETSI